MKASSHTGGVELLVAVQHLNGGFPAERVLGAAREETARDVLVYPLLIARQVACVGCGMDGRVRFVVFPALPRPIELAVLQPRSVQEEHIKCRC